MTLKNNSLLLLLFCFFSLAFFSGCGVYSFTGTSLPPEVKTISIANIPNNSGQGPSFLSQSITTTFRDYYQRNTNLKVLPREGDLELEAQILSYAVTPIAPQVQNGIDVASRNRLTITIQVKYTNNKDPKQNFDLPFSGFEDFEQNLNVNAIPEATIRNIVENKMLVEIFNKTVANW